MTIKSLYEWAVDNNVEEYELYIQYRDEGGYYSGRGYVYDSDAEIDRLRKEVTL